MASTKPFRRRVNGGGRPYSLLRRGVPALPINHQPETEEVGGYLLTISRAPCWRAECQTGPPFFVVSDYGQSREDAINKVLERIRVLREGKYERLDT